MSKATCTWYWAGPSLDTRHECEQNPPHENPVIPRLIGLVIDDHARQRPDTGILGRLSADTGPWKIHKAHKGQYPRIPERSHVRLHDSAL